MSEIVKSELPLNITDGERKFFSDTDPDDEFLQRIATDHGFRHQLTQLLTTYNISRYSADDLGYESRPFAEMSYLIEHLELDHLSENEKRVVANTVLGASIEVRDDLDAVFEVKNKRDRFSSESSYASALPFPLQFVLIAKACSGQAGSTLYPSALSADSEQRAKLHGYIVHKFGHSDDRTGGILDAAAIVHGASILKSHFEYGFESENWRTASNFPNGIVGVPATRIGYFLPDNVEEALRTGDIEDSLWRIEYLGDEWSRDSEKAEEDQKFIDGIEWLADRVSELSGKSQEEVPFWRGYVITSLFTSKAFEDRHVSGYSAGYDQLVSWREPKPDSEHWESYIELLDDIRKYGEATGELVDEGVLLALQGAAIRIGHDLEQEIIYGSEKKRNGRMKVLADIYEKLTNRRHSSDIELYCPLLMPHIIEKANKWRYRFS